MIVVDTWNERVPVGSPVRYWRGVAWDGEGQTGRTRSEAQLLGGHTPVVWIEGCSGCIALSHVEVLTEDEYAEAVQRQVPDRPGLDPEVQALLAQLDAAQAAARTALSADDGQGWLDAAARGADIHEEIAVRLGWREERP